MSITQLQITSEEEGITLAAFLRQRLHISWNAARQLCTTGKVFLGDKQLLDPALRVAFAMDLCIKPNAPIPKTKEEKKALSGIVYEDAHLVVLNKPAGISSVPYNHEETHTAMDLVRESWRLQGRKATTTPLHVVHRIDKETSGLLMFAKTKAAEVALQLLLRQHDVERQYLCVAHGRVYDQRIESVLVPDRGDGLRGTVRRGDRQPGGKTAITHVKAIEFLPQATVCEVRLETGKTHQIRIHFSELGHPLLGEPVYIRDFVRHGNEPIEAPRLFLHAQTLGFLHPVTKEKLFFSQEPPQEFVNFIKHLRKKKPASKSKKFHSL